MVGLAAVWDEWVGGGGSKEGGGRRSRYRELQRVYSLPKSSSLGASSVLRCHDLRLRSSLYHSEKCALK